MPPKFRELSSIDQFRVCRFLTRGESPDDPELAAITLDVAKHYQTKSRALAALFRWLPAVLALSLLVSTFSGALDGQAEMVIFFLLAVFGVAGNIMLNPWSRPKNVARSMEASKRIVSQLPSRDDQPSGLSH